MEYTVENKNKSKNQPNNQTTNQTKPKTTKQSSKKVSCLGKSVKKNEITLESIPTCRLVD